MVNKEKDDFIFKFDGEIINKISVMKIQVYPAYKHLVSKGN